MNERKLREREKHSLEKFTDGEFWQSGGILDSAHIEIANDAKSRLKRSLRIGYVSRSDKQRIEEILQQAFWEELTAENVGRVVEFDEAEKKTLSELREFFDKLKQISAKGAESLNKAREVLSARMENPETAQRIAAARRVNLLKNRSKESLSRGGKIGGKNRAAKLSAEERSRIAGVAGAAKRGKVKQERCADILRRMEGGWTPSRKDVAAQYGITDRSALLSLQRIAETTPLEIRKEGRFVIYKLK